MKIVTVDASKITSKDILHDVFSQSFGFPSFYGRNMDAWVDCMSSLDTDMNEFRVEEGEIVVLQLDNVSEFKNGHPDLYAEIAECSAFVNWRRMQMGKSVLLALSYTV